MRELLQIGEVARLIGASTKTIRYYHEIGLLPEPERTESGYRLYTAQHLLRLQRIRRLRALGLSLERIRAILDEAPENNESTLRAALHALVEETSAQILELEERRSFLQQLLARDELEPADKDAYLLLSPELKAQLAPQFESMSTEYLAWGQRMDAMLGAFHWPDTTRTYLQAQMQYVADHAEEYRTLFALEERFAALASLAEDDPDVERLADEYVQSQEMALLYQQLANFDMGEEKPFSSALGGLMSSIASPAQQRFFALLSQKISSRRADTLSTSTIEQEQ
ncbi:helix-turn-helix domain-containing protein [Tengunoibacter tsumagoiensis]|uniref:MerR family transcriptional regulator n=1 Tax=Tengunoibacter tsumagoiensis TaxID=2014871 RepID=A0A402A6Y1_9CHLR|nr:MerR family transcriptional regulator [Tengunoibacter tsumagoiensis]GCE14893.1 MerR family transcriptional regulator [Tengunoibacter tsumagoiensis]